MAITLEIPGGTVQLSGNPIWCHVTGAVKPIGATNYNILLKVESVDSVLTGGPFVDAIPPDADGEAWFDISGLVDRPFIPDFDYPDVGAVGSYIDAIWNLRLTAGETYLDANGDRAETYGTPTLYNHQIIKGGISNTRLGEYNDANTTFFKEVIEKGKFLTNQPDQIRISPDQPVKLWLISPFQENTDTTLNCTGIYEDDSEAVVQLPFSLFRDGLFEFSCAPAHIGIPVVSLEGKKLIRYYVGWAEAQAGDIREFEIDWQYYENLNYLFVSNSVGGVDVIRLTGAVKTSIDVSRNEGVQPMAYGASARTPSVRVTSKSGRKKYTINTGFKTTAEMQGMEDVYLSRNIWLLINGRLTPVNLDNGDQLILDSMEDIHSVELELLEGHNAQFV